MAVTVTQVIDDVLVRLKNIPILNQDAIFYVYSDQEFIDKIDPYMYPMVGVWYEGTFTNPQDKSGYGLSSTLIINLFVIGAPTEMASVLEDKNNITAALDDIRGAFKLTNSPTGHKWQFLSEAPYPLDENNFVYIQRWQTPIILV